MKNLYSLSEPEFELIVALSLSLLGYISYYFIAFSDSATQANLKLFGLKNNELHQFVLQKTTGFIFMGIFPLLFLTFFLDFPVKFGFGENIHLQTLYWVVGIALAIIPINFLIAGKAENLKQYPQIRISTWEKSTFALNFIGWAIYLLGYEYLFRGVLFLGSLPMLGLIPAIVLNVVIYSLAHLPKGMKETLGSIPVGLLICVITYKTGNIWASFFIHLTMAISNELFAFYRHPEMHFKKITH